LKDVKRTVYFFVNRSEMIKRKRKMNWWGERESCGWNEDEEIGKEFGRMMIR
jgi:hypothetical protein